MSEAMAIERLIEGLLKLEGYLTEPRVPYIPIYNWRGEKKKDTAAGDIDVLAYSPKNKKLIAVEVKGYGSAESYENWCKPSRIVEIYGLASFLVDNIDQILIKKWDDLYKKKKKFNEIYIIIPGIFIQKRKANKYKNIEIEGSNFTNMFIKKTNKLFKEKKHKEQNYLKLLEKELKKEFKINIKVIPIHQLIEKLILKVQEDMKTRRVRYPETALELIRWMIRAIEHDSFDFSKIQAELMKQKC